MESTIGSEMMSQDELDKNVEEKKYGPQPLMSREMAEGLLDNPNQDIREAAKKYLKSLTELEKLNVKLRELGHK